jgi:hypothetical protein
MTNENQQPVLVKLDNVCTKKVQIDLAVSMHAYGNIWQKAQINI